MSRTALWLGSLFLAAVLSFAATTYALRAYVDAVIDARIDARFLAQEGPHR